MTTKIDKIDYQRVHVDDLYTFDKNPRRGDVAKIADSLRARGQYRPIVVNRGTHTGRDMEVLAGNHTLLAARSLGWTHIDCGIVDVDEQTARQIVLADNRLSDLGDYDDTILHELLSSIDDLDGTGYTEEQLDDLDAAVAALGEDVEWDSAFDNMPGDTPSSYTRTFTLTSEQAEVVDAAIDAAKAHLSDSEGNANGNALEWIARQVTD